MKALLKYDKGPGQVELQEWPDPQPQAGQVKLSIPMCGICGTDLHVYHNRFKHYPPVILGHEFVGKIIDAETDVSELDPSQEYAVLGAVGITCGNCSYCQSGNFMFCANRRGMGHGIHGAFAPSAVVRPDQLYALPKSVSQEAGALIEPLASAVHAVLEIGSCGPGDIAMVSGPGPIGLMIAKLLLAQGVYTIVAGLSSDDFRLQKALSFGVQKAIRVDKDPFQNRINRITQGQGVDVAFEVAGAEASVNNCLDALRPMGQFIQVGHFGKSLQVGWDHIAFKQLKILGSVGYTRATWDRTIKLLEQGAVDCTDLITHRLALSEWKEGFELMESGQAIKVLLHPQN